MEVTLEIPLIVFLLLTGTSVGAAFIGAVAEVINGFKHDGKYAQISRWGAYIAFPAIALGLLVSLAHIPLPQRFFMGLTNAGSAWISREAISGITLAVFTFLYGAIWFFSSKQQGSSLDIVRGIFAILAAIVGITMLYMQSAIYAFTRTIPTWNTPLTLAFFAVYSLSLGSLSIAAVLAIRYLLSRKEEERESYRAAMEPFPAIGVFSVFLLGVIAVLWSFHLIIIPDSRAIELAKEIVFSSSVGLSISMVIIGLVAPLILLILAWERMIRQPRWMASSLIASFILVLVGGGIARALFFLAAIHVTSIHL